MGDRVPVTLSEDVAQTEILAEDEDDRDMFEDDDMDAELELDGDADIDGLVETLVLTLVVDESEERGLTEVVWQLEKESVPLALRDTVLDTVDDCVFDNVTDCVTVGEVLLDEFVECVEETVEDRLSVAVWQTEMLDVVDVLGDKETDAVLHTDSDNEGDPEIEFVAE